MQKKMHRKTIAINSTNVAITVAFVRVSCFFRQRDIRLREREKNGNLCVFDHFCHFRLSALLPLFFATRCCASVVTG